MSVNLIETVDVYADAQRTMNICNACRYCEGLCATFQAMTEYRSFSDQNLDYLANLCHNCTACYHGCQYVAPHEFDVNVPVILSRVRVQSYQRHAWPSFLGRAFERNGLLSAWVISITITLLLIGVSWFQTGEVVFGRHLGPGAFYQVISHSAMVSIAAITFGFSLIALAVGYWKFSREIKSSTAGEPDRSQSPIRRLKQAAQNALTLKYLGGAEGDGCSQNEGGFTNQRRYFHHIMMWGFLLCFASTITATFYDYVLGEIAPYAFLSLPVILGTLGGVGLLIGPAGLFWLKRTFDARVQDANLLGIDYALLFLLFIISLTGLALLFWRESAAMGMLLTIHLGFVFALFVMLPYGKFVHSIYRFAALVNFARRPGPS